MSGKCGNVEISDHVKKHFSPVTPVLASLRFYLDLQSPFFSAMPRAIHPVGCKVIYCYCQVFFIDFPKITLLFVHKFWNECKTHLFSNYRTF